MVIGEFMIKQYEKNVEFEEISVFIKEMRNPDLKILQAYKDNLQNNLSEKDIQLKFVVIHSKDIQGQNFSQKGLCITKHNQKRIKQNKFVKYQFSKKINQKFKQYQVQTHKQKQMSQQGSMLQAQRNSNTDEISFTHKQSNGQSDTEQMQQYLYEQVLQQGYDGEEFRQFLKQKYPGAEEDLSKITFDQLKFVTQEFQQQSQANFARISIDSDRPQNGQIYLIICIQIQQMFLELKGLHLCINSLLNCCHHKILLKKIQINQYQLLHSSLFNSTTFIFFKFYKIWIFINILYINFNLQFIKIQIESPNCLMEQQQKNQIPCSRQTSVSQSTFNPKSRASCELSLDQLNDSILNSTFSQSRVIKDAKGQTIVRKEAQIVAITSQAKDNFIKKNIEGEETSKVISCKSMKPTKISEYLSGQQNEILSKSPQKIKVIVNKYEIVFDGLFSSEYALYSVQTPVFEWNVQRRFNDFYWLYTTFKKHYPGTFVPPIPRKTAIKEMTQDHLYQRMRLFEYFLNEILICPQLSVSPFLSDFLSCVDQKTFEAQRKEHDLKPAPSIVDEISTVNGELISEVTPAIKEFWQQFSDLNQKSLSQYDNISDCVDNLIGHLKRAGDESNKMAISFSTMHKAHEQFNKLAPLGKNSILENMNIHLNNYFIDFGARLYDIAVAYEKNFYEYIRFQKQMIDEYKITIKTQNEIQNNYLDHLKKLNQKKDKLFQTTNTTKWEIDAKCPLSIRELQANKVEALKYMLPTETNQVQNEGEIFGYINKSLYEDVCMHMAYSKDQMSNKFISLTQDIALEINKLHIHTAEANIKFSELLGHKNTSLNQRYRPE